MADADADENATQDVTVPVSENEVGVVSPWWTESRKVLIGWIIAVALTPISVGVSTWVTNRYKQPYPTLESFETTIYFQAVPASSEFVDRINANTLLAAGLRRDLVAQRETSKEQVNCAAWLDNGEKDWYDSCAPIYADVFSSTHAELLRAIDELKHGIDAEMDEKNPLMRSVLRASSRPDQLMQFSNADKIVTNFLAELERIGKVPRVRSGDASFNIGVLNHGDSDGVVYDTATLKFAGKSLEIEADSFIPIKAHSFEKVMFNTGAHPVDQEGSYKAWVALVKKGEPLPYSITVNLSDRTATSNNQSIGKDQ